MNKLRRFFLYSLIFSICFQTWEPFGTPYINVTFLCFFAYLITCIPQYHKLFSMAYARPYIVPVGLLWILLFIMTSINDFPGSTGAYSAVRQLLMQILFFLLLYNELIDDCGLGDRLLQVFVYGVLFLSVLYLLGIGVEYVGEGRLSMLENNPNAVGFWYTLAMLIIIKFLFEKKACGWKRPFYMALMILFVSNLAVTGSRSAVVVLFLGSSLYLLLTKRPTKLKLPVLFFGFLLVALLSSIIFQELVVQERFAEELEEFSLGGRLDIWREGLDAFLSSPLVGLGASGWESWINNSFPFYRYKTLHNEYLSTLCYAGLAGFALFMLFLWRIYSDVFKQDTIRGSAFPAAVFFSVLVYLFTSTIFTFFVTWFIFAYLASSKFHGWEGRPVSGISQ